MELDRQPAAFEISFRLIPKLLALLVDAFLVECVVKTVISIPANPRNSLIYLAIVDAVTG